MEKKTYSEKLQDPRWQKKRLLILNRDGWQCSQCKNEKKSLHVHHLKYFPGADPWDYNDEFLITLCHECHAAEHGAAQVVVELERRYAHLIPAITEPDVITSINQQIGQLTNKLSTNSDPGLEEEILKNLMFLYDLKKKLNN